VLIVGGELDEPNFIKIIEGQGARIVGDTTCFGTRSFDELIPQFGDPLESLCRFYFFKTGCSRMVGGFPQRYEYIERLRRDCRADGIIFQRMKFCDPWGVEGHNLIHRFKHKSRPILVLEREYGASAAGQVRTRVQAYLEALGK